MEDIWEAQKGAPAVLFAIPDKTTQTNNYDIAIPKLASLYLTHDWNGEIKGIKECGDQHPPVAPVFWAFRIMVGMGMTFAGWVALIASWYVTEIGRQPWLVQGVLTAAQAASKVPASNIAFTLVMYRSMNAVLLTSYVNVLFYLARKASSPEPVFPEVAYT